MVVGGAVLGFAALRRYRAAPFIGIAQLHGDGDDDEPLALDGLHRWLRHTLYSTLLLMLWGTARSPLGLDPATWQPVNPSLGRHMSPPRPLARYEAPCGPTPL